MITILQLTALNDSDEVLLITADEHGQKRFLHVDRVSPLLEPLDPQRFRHKKLLYGGLNSNIDVNIKPQIIFNSIGNPDRCSRMLTKVTKIAENNPFPVINHPSKVPNVQPHHLYALSHDIDDLIVPKSTRVTPNSLASLQTTLTTHGLQAPYIIKEVGCDPESQNSYLLKNDEDIHVLERFAFDGRAYDVTAYHDYRSDDGLFRKHRFFVIGDTLYPAHMIISSTWKITNDQEAHEGLESKKKKLLKEEKHFLKRYQTRQFPALLALKERVGLDFFAIDCHVMPDERIVLFGIDCESHYFERLKEHGYYNEKQIQQYNRAVETMIMTKLKRSKEDEDV